MDRRTYPEGAYTLTLVETLEFPALERDSVHLKVQSETVRRLKNPMLAGWMFLDSPQTHAYVLTIVSEKRSGK